jgi:hemerythrin superfamily protein
MPNTARTRTTSRAASTARNQVLQQLKDDHKRVKKAYRDFQKLDSEEDLQACEAIVQQVLQELTVHAALEEKILYPAAREAISDEDLIDEAEVEHESMHIFLNQLRSMGPEDEKYAARFTVLCEYVLHHVKEEEGEIFPQLQRARLDWERLAQEMDERRRELAPVDEDAAKGGDPASRRGEPTEDEDMPVGHSGDDTAAHSRRSSATRRS